MGIFLLILAALWLIWNLSFRALYLSWKHKTANPISIPSDMTKDILYKKLQTELTYPQKQSVHYDANGNISVAGKYKAYPITFSEDGSAIYVAQNRKEQFGKDSGKYIEEVACIDAYVRKMFHPSAPVDPYRAYKNMKSHMRRFVITQIVMVFLCILALVIPAKEAGIDDAITSKNISESYLTQYSSTVTVGDAFDNFFSDGKWRSYSEGALEYVDYTGTCTYMDEPATVVIRFYITDEQFRVDKVFMNGSEASVYLSEALFLKIYE